MSNTDACTALTKSGKPCGKNVGTSPTKDGPRCFTHMQRDTRRADPGARAPVKVPKTAADATRLVAWAMGRAAEGKLSAPAANAVSMSSRVFLRLLESNAQETIDALVEALGASAELLTAYEAAKVPGAPAAMKKVLAALAKVPGRRDAPAVDDEPGPSLSVIATDADELEDDDDEGESEG
jgi:hypothetical protein